MILGHCLLKFSAMSFHSGMSGKTEYQISKVQKTATMEVKRTVHLNDRAQN